MKKAKTDRGKFMSICEEYKLGITRNRLTEIYPTVSFLGEYKEEFSQEKLLTAFSLLIKKEPLLNKRAIILSNGEAVLRERENELKPEFVECEDVCEFYRKKKNEFLNPLKELFKFYVVNNRYIAAFCHTAVSDAKSLLILNGEFSEFYEDKKEDVTPKKVFLYSGKKDIPSNLNTLVIEKITGELQLKWYKKRKRFKKEDYDNFFSKCESGRGVVCESFTVSPAKRADLKKYCGENGTDFSTEICRLFYNALKSEKGSIKYNSIRWGGDLRLYFENPGEYGVGPFGIRTTVMKPKKKNIVKNGEVKAFHDEIYKKITSPFCAFYDDLFLNNLSPAFCDAANFAAKGVCRVKCAKKLAKNYGCGDKKKLTFDFYNLDASCYTILNSFDSVVCNDAFSGRDDFYVSVIVRNGCAQIDVTADNNKYNEQKIIAICEKIKKEISENYEF